MKKLLILTASILLWNLNIYSQEEKLEIEGAIQIGNAEDPTPDPGTIRFNPANNDFEGWDGTQWWSLTNKPAPPFTDVEESKLTASDGAAGDYFGRSVSISGDYALIGAWRDDDNGSSSGSAYVFIRSGTTWTEQAKLTASDAAADDRFGLSVDISGDYALIGAYGDDDKGSSAGAAYFFK